MSQSREMGRGESSSHGDTSPSSQSLPACLDATSPSWLHHHPTLRAEMRRQSCGDERWQKGEPKKHQVTSPPKKSDVDGQVFGRASKAVCTIPWAGVTSMSCATSLKPGWFLPTFTWGGFSSNKGKLPILVVLCFQALSVSPSTAKQPSDGLPSVDRGKQEPRPGLVVDTGSHEEGTCPVSLFLTGTDTGAFFSKRRRSPRSTCLVFCAGFWHWFAASFVDLHFVPLSGSRPLWGCAKGKLGMTAWDLKTPIMVKRAKGYETSPRNPGTRSERDTS
ncbi:hypothetical protein V8F20_009352 [Naviculisporaceae sp. PSN 640]